MDNWYTREGMTWNGCNRENILKIWFALLALGSVLGALISFGYLWEYKIYIFSLILNLGIGITTLVVVLKWKKWAMVSVLIILAIDTLTSLYAVFWGGADTFILAVAAGRLIFSVILCGIQKRKFL